MKRTVATLTALAAVAAGAAVYAQAPAAGTPATCKVGVINMNQVVKGYKQANELGEYLIKLSKFYNDERAKIEAQITAKKEAVGKEQDAAKKDALAAEIKDHVRQIEDLAEKARKDVEGKQGEIAVRVFKSIEDVVARIAKSNGLEMVVFYPDATTDAEKYTPMRVVQKLSSPSMMPLYVDPRLDYTAQVVETLNTMYPPSSGVQPTGATTPQK